MFLFSKHAQTKSKLVDDLFRRDVLVHRDRVSELLPNNTPKCGSINVMNKDKRILDKIKKIICRFLNTVLINFPFYSLLPEIALPSFNIYNMA